MTTLQLIIKKAKALRAASPKKFAKWTDYIKAASATIKPKKKATVGAVKKKAAPKKVVKKAPVKKVVKKTTTKKASSIHKDTKSHNVRISVMSGISPLENLNRLIKEKEKVEIKIDTLKINLKGAGDVETKKQFKFWIIKYKNYLQGLKKQITEAKKYV